MEERKTLSAEEWLKAHAYEIGPEEISSEKERMAEVEEEIKIKEEILSFNTWPAPIMVENLGIFKDIVSKESFNNIVGNPENWPRIKSNRELYKKWILPHAILLFGKTWFDKVKFRHWSPGAKVSIFSREERKLLSSTSNIENTLIGRAKIAKVISKVIDSLSVYLDGKWYERDKTYIKLPGAYIIVSLKNEFTRDSNNSLGLKIKSVPVCPRCISVFNNTKHKMPLIRHSKNQYKCPKCKSLSDNLENLIKRYKDKKDHKNVEKYTKEYHQVLQFSTIPGVTCVCPSESCSGKFVPLTCIDKDAISKSELKKITEAVWKYNSFKGIRKFKVPTNLLKSIPLICPFCYEKFTPCSAIKKGAGFKGKSGHFTGLPTMTIWEDYSSNSVNSMPLSDTILAAGTRNIDKNIASKQKIDFLIGECVIRMSKSNCKIVSGLISWCFYSAAIEWMVNYWEDAARYFFGWSVNERNMTEKELLKYPGLSKKRVTHVIRGREGAIHQSFFHIWMKVLEKNISKFRVLDSSIRSLKDFKWFCRPPKYSGGPKTTFYSEVNSKGKISNNSSIFPIDSSRPLPRLAKIYSINKIKDGKIDRSINYIDNMQICEWQAIKLFPNSSLKPGDKVKVDCLVMPGHPSHAPIQRVLRLRSMVFAPIIETIRNEEKIGKSNILFWKEWKEKHRIARERTKIKVSLRG